MLQILWPSIYIIIDDEKTYFRGNLTEISAKTKTLVVVHSRWRPWPMTILFLDLEHTTPSTFACGPPSPTKSLTWKLSTPVTMCKLSCPNSVLKQSRLFCIQMTGMGVPTRLSVIVRSKQRAKTYTAVLYLDDRYDCFTEAINDCPVQAACQIRHGCFISTWQVWVSHRGYLWLSNPSGVPK